MWSNIKLYFKYILLYSTILSLKNRISLTAESSIFVSSKSLYFLLLHLRLSSLFYTTHLIDIFSYQSLYLKSQSKTPYKNVIVYNFHSLKTLERFFIFCINYDLKNDLKTQHITSTESIYSSSNWLEREVFELSGVFFANKQDTRNLLLQYGDLSKPFMKHFPSIGYIELNYDLNTDMVLTLPVSSQF
jgi:NADH:ubiquinone oxidoreductase subunit C